MSFRRIAVLFLLIFSSVFFSENLYSQCNNDAGTIKSDKFIGLSSRHDRSDTVFLCWKDRIIVDHDDDFSLVSDPNKATPGGIGYGWFTDKPTVAGKTKSDIFIGNDEYRIPSDPTNMMITAQNFNGDAELANDYYNGNISFNQAINGSGAPTLMYYAAMTYDIRRNGIGYFEDDANGVNGPCVNVDVDGAFPVVYLNPIKISNIFYNVDGDPLKVSFIVKGGLPEFYKLKYSKSINYKSISIFNDYYFDLSQGRVLTSSFSHGDRVTVLLPEYGAFNVEIEDGVSCLTRNSLNVATRINPTFKLDTMSGELGSRKCLNFSVRDYSTIREVIGNFKYDPTKLRFDTIDTLPYSPNVYLLSKHLGKVGMVWSTDPTTLSDNTDYFWVCFYLTGEPGDCVPVELDDFGVAFDDTINNDLYPYLEPGLICINPPNGLYVSSHQCGAKSGVPEGSITFKVFNGVAPYDYIVRQGATIIESGSVPEERLNVSVVGVLPGEYIIDMTDANLDTYSDTIRVLQSEPLKFDSLAVDNPSCYGAKDGQIRVFVKDGDFLNYNTKWSTKDYNIDTLSEIGNGIYGVTIEDAYGCETDTFVSLITTDYEYKLDIIQDALCEGINDASISLTVSGGNVDPNKGYTFKWRGNNGEFLKDNAVDKSVFQNVGPGKGRVVFYGDEDYRFCDDTIFFDIDTRYEMEVAHNATDLECGGDSNGVVNFSLNLNDFSNDTFEVVPGWPIYKFNKVSNDKFDMIDLKAGTKIVKFTEIHTGCEIADTVELSEPFPISISSPTIINANCGADGRITLSIFGGSSPYTCTGIGSDITLQDGESHSFDSLDEGEHILLITDSSGCSREAKFFVDKAAGALKIDTIEYIPLGCDPNALTDITVNASSSFSTISYEWKKLDETSLGTEKTLKDVGEGTYIINLSDGLCNISDTIELLKGAPFTYSSLVSEAECGPGETGGLLGGVCINVDGDKTGFTYTWSDGSTGECLANAQAGDYKVTISSGNGCTIEDEFTVGGAPPIEIRVLDIDGVSCNDGNHTDGRAVLQASGGDNTTGIYSFSFSNGKDYTGLLITADDLPNGVVYYTVSYNKLSGAICAKHDSLEIGIPAKLELDRTAVKVIRPSCFGECDGQAIVLAKGGNNQAYYYHWQETGEDGAVGSGMCKGTYHVQITDANNCTTVDSVVIDEPEKLVVMIDSLNTKDVNCSGSSSGQVKINYTGGNVGGDFTFKWSPDVSTTKLANNLPKGVYTVTVTDERGCTAFISHEVKGQVPLVFNVLQNGEIKCYGEKTCIYLDTVYGGAGPDYSFSVNGGPLFSVDSCASLYASEDPYLVSVFDSEGCKSESEILITQPEQVVVDLGGEVVVDLGDTKTIHLKTNTNVLNVLWEIDTTQIGYRYLNNQHSELEIEAYTNSIITATITDVNGCQATGDLNVLVNTFRNVYIPNIFTPDGDGVNDNFYITIGKGIERINYFKIFNRWGQLMHEETDMAPTSGDIGSWDGTFKGRKVNPGAYVYLIEVEFLDGRTILYRGSITVVR